MGGHFELTGAESTKYYFAGSQRIAMRKGTTLYYLLSDHLGSTSLVTDASGNKVSEMGYKAWGEVRYTSGTTPTDYGFTGQYSHQSDFGLMFYNSRYYDSYLNHFTQPDSIVPDPYNSQDYDRYAYARNNPVRYSDPSGHTSCEGDNWDDGPQCTSHSSYSENAKSDYRKTLQSKYKWFVQGGFSLNELRLIFDTARGIENYLTGIIGTRSLDWMVKNIGNINIWKNNLSDTPTNFTLPGNIVLESNWSSHDAPAHWLTHELGHIWDYRTSGNIFMSGGVGDSLNDYINSYNGGISSTLSCRYCNQGYPITNDQNIPSNMAFPNSASNGYGNGATADYLAEAFAFSVNKASQNIPNGVQEWIATEISQESLYGYQDWWGGSGTG